VGTKKLVGDEDVSDNTSYAESSDFEDSFDEVGSEGQVVMRPSRYRRFKETEGMPEFSLGMKFGSKQEFRQAMIRYGLAAKKVIKFSKNDSVRFVAVCTWKTCMSMVLQTFINDFN
jgi:alpha-galactosidase